MLLGAVAAAAAAGSSFSPISLAGVSVAPDAFYSIRKLVGWAGNCCDVVRVSDSASLTVGFSGNVIDLAAINTFSSGAIVQVSKWYDQSGNGYDAVQTTAGLRPRIDPTVSAQNAVISCELFIAVTQGNHFLSIPGALTGPASALSCVVAGRPISSRASSTLGRFIVFDTSIVSLQCTSAGFAAEGSGSNRSQIDVMADYGVFGFREGGGVISIRQPNHADNTIAGFTGTFTGATIANSAAGNTQGGLEVHAIAIWKAGLSSGDYTAAESALNGPLSYNTSFNRLVVWDGDSITQGTGSILGRNVVRYARGLFASNVKLMNIGLAGITLQTIVATPNRIDNANQEGYANQVVIQNAMTNDLAGGRTAAQMYADLQTWAGQVRAKGFKACVTTMTPRNDMSGPTLAIYNDVTAQVRAGWPSFADALSDRQADPTVGTIASSSDTTYYNDGLHPTSLCYSILAAVDAAAIIPLL